VVLRMLRVLARAEGYELLDAGEAPTGLASLVQHQPDGVIVASLAPAGLTQARYLCRRLRAQSPGVRIVVSRPGGRRGARKWRRVLLSAGADRVAPTLRETLGQVAQLLRTPARCADGAGGPDQPPQRILPA
jgi:hypothetical protein